MIKECGLRRRYRGLLRPADKAWHRWLRWGKPRRWGRERVLRMWRRADILAAWFLALLVVAVAAPVLVMHAVWRRPLSYRGFVLTATIFIGLGVVLTTPLWGGTAAGESREVWRDRATIIYFVLGAWIAFAYQKRSSDLTVVRDIYHQWLEVQSRATQAAVLLGRPASRLEQLRVLRQRQPEMVEPLSQRLLAEAREAHVACQDAAHRALIVGRRACSLHLMTVNDGALHVSQMLNSQLGVLASWQLEILGIPASTASPPLEVRQALDAVHRACETVTTKLEAWLRI